MGAWSAEPFGNDTAADWAYGLEGAKNLDLVRTALDAIAEQAGSSDADIDSDVGSEAIAAAAVVAHKLGADQAVTGYLNAEVVKDVRAINEVPDRALIGAAVSALVSVRLPTSELEELWEEEDEWIQAVATLEAFLRAAS